MNYGFLTEFNDSFDEFSFDLTFNLDVPGSVSKSNMLDREHNNQNFLVKSTLDNANVVKMI